MRSFRSLVEKQIARTRAAGGLSGLQGEGAPLPDRPVETGEQAALSTGMRIMAEAGVLPEEFALKKQLDAARKSYASCTQDAERSKLMRQIADLELRYGIAREARQKFMS
ncbi:DnaJ family domain-containing protein [uncultured Roseobacter sp.]|uniref:DnaJ family domain-containing protein n=1 Tax=uncultured Roseobacter sp. TaxID=114847 RepID=UPI002615E5B2|nr:DnaJ family domain-containing protein [uncultured Roseobacter sp.]